MVRDGLVKTLVVCSVLAGSAMGSHPARALDDGKGNSLLDVLDLVGLGEKKEEPVIQYRERPPLVLPPKTELRQPAPSAAQRAADWPQDPEAVRAAKRAQDIRGRANADDTNNPQYAGKLTRVGRINPGDSVEKPGPNQPCSMSPGAGNACDPTTFWKNLSVKSDKPEEKGLQAGVEPDRQYLTQPPKGYMAPTQSVKAGFEAPQPAPSIFDYVRNKVSGE